MRLRVFYKSLIVFSLFYFLLGCSSGFNIKDGAAKSQLDVSVAGLGKKTGLGSIFSGSGYRLELYSYDISKCELKDRVVRLNPFNLEETIEIPANEKLHLFYFYTAVQALGSNFSKETCARPIGFIANANHKYKFDFKLEPTRCTVKIVDMTNRREKPNMLGIPNVCMKKRHPIQ